MATTIGKVLRYLWSARRWAYGVYMLTSAFRIPARVGFRLHVPACDTRLTWENVGLSLTKIPHVILFGFFFLITALMFDHIDRRALSWSFGATVALGLLIEFEEGATRTGNCRLTDVLPDAWGALIGMALLMILVLAYGRVVARRELV